MAECKHIFDEYGLCFECDVKKTPPKTVEERAIEALIRAKAGSVLLEIKAGRIPGVIWVGENSS